MKNFLFVILFVVIATTANATITVTPITETDFDNLDPADAVWNAQFFRLFNSSQMSVGPGLSGDDDFAGTTWAVSPSTNSFGFSIDGASNLEASANGNTPATDPVTDAFNEIWLFLDVDSTAPDPADLLEISNMTISKDTDSFVVSALEVTGGTGFVGQKIRFDDEAANIGEFSLSGVLTQQFGSASGKSWLVSAVGVQGPIPEPESFPVLLGLMAFALVILRRRRS